MTQDSVQVETCHDCGANVGKEKVFDRWSRRYCNAECRRNTEWRTMVETLQEAERTIDEMGGNVRKIRETLRFVGEDDGLHF